MGCKGYKMPSPQHSPPGTPELRASHKPMLRQDLLRRITDQVAFYFSTDNLQSDMYLVSQMDKDSWVPIDTIAQFSRIRNLTTDHELILEALRGSSVVQLDEASRKLRPPKTNERNTIVIRNLDATTKVEQIREYFGEYQEAILHIKPEIGDNWFVDMRTEEVALEAIEHLRNQTAPDGMPLAVRIRSNTYLRGVGNNVPKHSQGQSSWQKPHSGGSSPETNPIDSFGLPSPQTLPQWGPAPVPQDPAMGLSGLNSIWLTSAGTFHGDVPVNPSVLGLPHVQATMEGFTEVANYIDGYAHVESSPEQSPDLGPQHHDSDASSNSKNKSKSSKKSKSKQEGSRTATEKSGQPQKKDAGVWSSVVSGAAADPKLAALEESRLEKAGLSMQHPETKMNREPAKTEQTAKPVQSTPPAQTHPVQSNLDLIPKPKPKVEGRSKPSSSPDSSPKTRASSPKLPTPKQKPKKDSKQAGGSKGAKGPKHVAIPAPAPKEFDREAWLEDTGWQVVGEEPKSKPRSKNSPTMPAGVSPDQDQSGSPHNQSGFSLAFNNDDEKPRRSVDEDDQIQLIDGAAKAVKARKSNSDKRKSKSGKGKRGSSSEAELLKTRPRSSVELASAWSKVAVDLFRNHAIKLIWAISPAIVVFFLYLFLFVL